MRDPLVSGRTSGLDSAPPKCPGYCCQGVSTTFLIEALADMLLPEDRLHVRDRRQRPCAGAWRPDIGVDVHVEQTRLAQLHCVLQRAFEIPDLVTVRPSTPAARAHAAESRL